MNLRVVFHLFVVLRFAQELANQPGRGPVTTLPPHPLHPPTPYNPPLSIFTSRNP